MAIETANILRTLNAQIDAKQAKRASEAALALKGMEMAQSQINFDEQMALTKGNNLMVQLGQVGESADNMTYEAAGAFWAGNLAMLHSQYYDPSDKTYEQTGWLGNKTDKFQADMIERGMKPADATKLFGLMKSYNTYVEAGASQTSEAVGIIKEIMSMYKNALTINEATGKFGNEGFARALAFSGSLDVTNLESTQSVIDDIERFDNLSKLKTEIVRQQTEIPGGDFEIPDLGAAYNEILPPEEPDTPEKQFKTLEAIDAYLGDSTDPKEIRFKQEEILKEFASYNYLNDMPFIPGDLKANDRKQMNLDALKVLKSEFEDSDDALEQLSADIQRSRNAVEKGWAKEDPEQAEKEAMNLYLLNMQTEMLSDDINKFEQQNIFLNKEIQSETVSQSLDRISKSNVF